MCNEGLCQISFLVCKLIISWKFLLVVCAFRLSEIFPPTLFEIFSPTQIFSHPQKVAGNVASCIILHLISQHNACDHVTPHKSQYLYKHKSWLSDTSCCPVNIVNIIQHVINILHSTFRQIIKFRKYQAFQWTWMREFFPGEIRISFHLYWAHTYLKMSTNRLWKTVWNHGKVNQFRFIKRIAQTFPPLYVSYVKEIPLQK